MTYSAVYCAEASLLRNIVHNHTLQSNSAWRLLEFGVVRLKSRPAKEVPCSDEVPVIVTS